MAFNLPPVPPQGTEFSSELWQRWFNQLRANLTGASIIPWSHIDFTGSNLLNILTRNHNDLQNIQGGAAGDYNHLTTAQVTNVNTIPTMTANIAANTAQINSNNVLFWISF